MQALAPSEREVVIAQLSESFAQDRLSLGEFEHRVAAAYRATTVADLTALTVDLTDRTDLAAGTRVAQSPYAGTSMMVGYVSVVRVTGRAVLSSIAITVDEESVRRA